MVDYIRHWSDRTELPKTKLLEWLGLASSKFYDWSKRYGKVNEHNGWVPRDHWLEVWEKQAIVDFYAEHQGDGYRRVTYMMMDDNIVAASPASVYRVLKASGAFKRWNRKESLKGKGFQQPTKPHQHWHMDISYINVRGTFYYLISVLDGASRYIVHWEIRESMKESDVEIVLQRAKERFPEARPRIISDNGPQFIAKEFKEFVRQSGMTHVRTSPYYPQSNGKIERWHKSLKTECVRRQTPLTLEDARRAVDGFVTYYNTQRLHSAIDYVTPRDKLEGRAGTIHAERDRKLAAARESRRLRRQAAKMSPGSRSCSDQTGECESPWSSVASASSHPMLGGVVATERKGRPQAVPEPRPSTPAGGKNEHQQPSAGCAGELLNTMDGLSNSR